MWSLPLTKSTKLFKSFIYHVTASGKRITWFYIYIHFGYAYNMCQLVYNIKNYHRLSNYHLWASPNIIILNFQKEKMAVPNWPNVSHCHLYDKTALAQTCAVGLWEWTGRHIYVPPYLLYTNAKFVARQLSLESCN